MRNFRPFSARTPDFQPKLSPILSSDVRMRSGKSNQPVTEEEIFMMKQELQALIREKNHLKNKIIKLMDIENNTQTKPKISQMKQNYLFSTVIKELEEYNSKKKEEIASLLQSDSASKITEMQEEIVILYNELQRMGEMKRQVDLMVKEATVNLDQTIKTFSPETVQRNQKTINSLEQEIAAQEERNRIARENLAKKESQPNDEEIEHAKFVMESSIKVLQKSIEDEEREIAQLDAEIDLQRNNDY